MSMNSLDTTSLDSASVGTTSVGNDVRAETRSAIAEMFDAELDSSRRSVADHALENLLGTAVSYGPGFANHGPMVVEALEHLDRTEAIDSFMADYRPRLNDKNRSAQPMDDWAAFVRAELGPLVPEVAALAGHGLLRLAHAVRAVERCNTITRRADLDEAVAYWKSGRGIAGPAVLVGQQSLPEVLAELPRLADVERGGMLTTALQAAAADERVQASLRSLAAPEDPQIFLDALAMASADRYVANGDDRAFVFIHGVTVSTMASVLLPYLDAEGQARLCASVAGFVIYAVAGFDLAFDQPHGEDSSILAAISGHDSMVSPGALAAGAAETLDDHTIKFTDACLALSQRTGRIEPLVAAATRIAAMTKGS